MHSPCRSDGIVSVKFEEDFAKALATLTRFGTREAVDDAIEAKLGETKD